MDDPHNMLTQILMNVAFTFSPLPPQIIISFVLLLGHRSVALDVLSHQIKLSQVVDLS